MWLPKFRSETVLSNLMDGGHLLQHKGYLSQISGFFFRRIDLIADIELYQSMFEGLLCSTVFVREGDEKVCSGLLNMSLTIV